MQNSLQRIFDGLEHTLRTVLAPSLEDPYLQSQVSSVAEIIANLSTRVEWKSAHLLDVTERVRPVLERAAERARTGLPRTRDLLARPAPTAGLANAALLEARDEHLWALREVQRSLESAEDEELEAAIREFLGWQLAHESALLRTATTKAKK
jgi:hypothetical protein